MKPVGTTGHQVQPYALSIEVGASCVEDANDVGALGNELPRDAVIVRPDATVGAPFAFTQTLSRCANDVDVYELFAFSGENVAVSLTQLDTSPAGLLVELGTRPADLDNPAVVVVGSALADVDVIAFANDRVQQLYVTVKAAPGIT